MIITVVGIMYVFIPVEITAVGITTVGITAVGITAVGITAVGITQHAKLAQSLSVSAFCY
ncbi:hypothetical protein SDC9_73121 [bioreactor metagenome]|uniref:Uncharacterized protein n=1 Tax=bioreactor metagenome TaxID=1076179 RepID=A0A644YEF7_9ZZZZ